MDAAEALADLTEISTQIRFAVLVDSDGGVVAGAGVAASEADAVARSARELLTAAEETVGGEESRERLVQLQVATPEGCVFLVRDGARLVAAVTGADPTVGLIFYDLKTCLRHAAGDSLAPKPAPRTGSVESTSRDGGDEG